MTAAYFEDHPTDPDKMIMRKPSMKVEGPFHVVCQCDKCKAQPQRTWVGLTDEEKKSFWTADQMTQEEWGELFNAIEAKLKEKNT